MLLSVRKFQALEDVSCIQLNHPEVNIVINDSDIPKEVKIKDSVTGKSITLAPGKGIIPSNIMRELKKSKMFAYSASKWKICVEYIIREQ